MKILIVCLFAFFSVASAKADESVTLNAGLGFIECQKDSTGCAFNADNKVVTITLTRPHSGAPPTGNYTVAFSRDGYDIELAIEITGGSSELGYARYWVGMKARWRKQGEFAKEQVDLLGRLDVRSLADIPSGEWRGIPIKSRTKKDFSIRPLIMIAPYK